MGRCIPDSELSLSCLVALLVVGISTLFRNMALLRFKTNKLLWTMAAMLVLVTGSRAQPTSAELNRATMCLIQLGFLQSALRSCMSYITEDSWSRAIIRFQSLEGLDKTGELDEETISAMSLYKCEVKEQGRFDISRTKRYSFIGEKRLDKNLTYSILKYSSKLTTDEVDWAIAEAFSVWERYTDFTFTQEESDTDNIANIKICFVEGNHGDNDPFDGLGTFNGGHKSNILAHAYFNHRLLHFDDAEPWTVDSHGKNLIKVAVHEIGHILGLDHSDVKSAIMYGNYKSHTPDGDLDQDDIDGIQELYPIETFEDNPSNDSPIDHLEDEWTEY